EEDEGDDDERPQAVARVLRTVPREEERRGEPEGNERSPDNREPHLVAGREGKQHGRIQPHLGSDPWTSGSLRSSSSRRCPTRSSSPRRSSSSCGAPRTSRRRRTRSRRSAQDPSPARACSPTLPRATSSGGSGRSTTELPVPRQRATHVSGRTSSLL